MLTLFVTGLWMVGLNDQEKTIVRTALRMLMRHKADVIIEEPVQKTGPDC
jgi:hypothetical protein